MEPQDSAVWQVALVGQGGEPSTTALQASMIAPAGGQCREVLPYGRLGRARTEHLIEEHIQELQGALGRGNVQSGLRMPRA
eukprot:5741693-Alexandrium_andersonii.AAC.1